MPPLWLTLRLRTGRGTSVRLGLPLFLVWLALLPVALVLLPLFVVACVVARINPLGALAFGWSLLRATCGTHIEIAAPGTFVFMHVY